MAARGRDCRPAHAQLNTPFPLRKSSLPVGSRLRAVVQHNVFRGKPRWVVRGAPHIGAWLSAPALTRTPEAITRHVCRRQVLSWSGGLSCARAAAPGVTQDVTRNGAIVATQQLRFR